MHKKAYVEYRPLGVLGIIAPWNYPFHNLYNHVISGLFAGNAVVSKVRTFAHRKAEGGSRRKGEGESGCSGLAKPSCGQWTETSTRHAATDLCLSARFAGVGVHVVVELHLLLRHHPGLARRLRTLAGPRAGDNTYTHRERETHEKDSHHAQTHTITCTRTYLSCADGQKLSLINA